MRRMSELVRHQDPLVLPPETSVKHACECMRERGVGAVLVADHSGRLVGIFTGRDAVCRMLAEGRSSASTILAKVMTRNPQTTPPGNTTIDALRRMRDGGFRHLPVVDNGTLLGIVSRGDFRGREQDRLEEETVLWERI
jgi:CBS domain-containing protein